MLDELRDHVAKVIGPIAKPDEIIFTPDLPKTRSGKIMRRLLRDVARGNTLGRRHDPRERRDRRADPRPGRVGAARSEWSDRSRRRRPRSCPSARVGHLGTQRMGKWPHVVPVCHVLDLDRVVIASGYDRKIEDIRENASVTYCVDAYPEDWDNGLAQVVVSGEAYLIESGPEFERDRALLYEKFPQYETCRADRGGHDASSSSSAWRIVHSNGV